jgi:hypothetical protein
VTGSALYMLAFSTHPQAGTCKRCLRSKLESLTLYLEEGPLIGSDGRYSAWDGRVAIAIASDRLALGKRRCSVRLTYTLSKMFAGCVSIGLTVTFAPDAPEG